MSHSIPFCVQSYCFRHFKDNAEVAAKVREIGLERVELCGVHADFDQPEAFAHVAAIYRTAGIAIDSIGVQAFDGDDRERNWFECAALAGARHISCHLHVDTYLRAIPKIRRWSREYGIRVGLHCHGGYLFGGQPDVLEHLLSLGSPEIGLCLDTAWAMQLGPYFGNPLEWVKKFSGRIYGVHLKDFTFESNGQWKDVLIGEGNLNLPAFVEALGESGFDGMAAIEYEGDIENPVPALARCVALMKANAQSA